MKYNNPCRWNVKQHLPVHFLPFPPTRLLPLSCSLQNSRIPLHQSAAMLKVNLLSSTTFPLPPDFSFSLRCSCTLTLRQRLYLSLMSYPLNLLLKPLPSGPPCCLPHVFLSLSQINCFLLLAHALSHPLFLLGCSPSFCLISEMCDGEADCAVILSLFLSLSFFLSHPPTRHYKDARIKMSLQQ